MQDKTIKCRDCGQEFVFTTGEQEFFAQKGFSEPIRCSTCRAARKSSRGESGFSAPRGDREMYPAVCGQCGKSTQVPFQPRDNRPVYCSECFSAQRAAGGSGYERRPSNGRSGGYSGGSDRSGGYGNGRSSERSGGYGGRDAYDGRESRGRNRDRGRDRDRDRYEDRW